MAYNKVSNKIQNKDIKYLNKDYNTFRNQLLEFTEVYFPNQFNDFSEGNPGMMFLEMAAYVGDVLSYYTDTQLRESFLLLAQEEENIFNLAYAMGYKPKVTTASSVNLDVFQLVPSKLINGSYEPDYDYTLDIPQDSFFKSEEEIFFHSSETIRFDFSSSLSPTTVSVYEYDSNNNPNYYLLKKSVKATSGTRKVQTFEIGDVQRFATLNLMDKNIISIEKIEDSNGNEWSEVPYLAQDTIFEEIENTAANDPELYSYNQQTPYLLKLKKVPRRFITRVKSKEHLQIQFGAGSSGEPDKHIVPNPENIGLGIKDGRNRLDVAYDPSNVLFTKAYGQAPANIQLTVTYMVGGGLLSNARANSITIIENIKNVLSKPNINPSTKNFIINSLAVNNPNQASGGGAGDTIEEIRMNTMANFSSQQRTVTKNDYLIRTLSMPPMLGRVAKAYITQDDQISPLTNEPNRIPNPLALNLYTLGYDNSKSLTTLNTATKTNLSTYLEQFRMLTDAINIKDAFIINFSIDFSITTFKNYNNQKVLLDCINEIKNYFSIDNFNVNQPIIMSEVEGLIHGVKGVQALEEINFKNQTGHEFGYSQYKYDFESATRKGVIYPSLDPSIFELKFPNRNINGRITTY